MKTVLVNESSQMIDTKSRMISCSTVKACSSRAKYDEKSSGLKRNKLSE